MRWIGVLGLTYLGVFYFGAYTYKNFTLKEREYYCWEQLSKKTKQITLDIKYHCNNNTCVNYAWSHYLLQCLSNRKDTL